VFMKSGDIRSECMTVRLTAHEAHASGPRLWIQQPNVHIYQNPVCGPRVVQVGHGDDTPDEPSHTLRIFLQGVSKYRSVSCIAELLRQWLRAGS